MAIYPMESGYAEFVADAQQLVYPQPMWEDQSDFERLLLATPKFSLVDGRLPYSQIRGWAIFTPEKGRIYLYDLATLPKYQHQGVAKGLFTTALKSLRWAGRTVSYHTRSMSYPLLSNVELLWSCGYEIVQDRFLHDHYGKVYGGGYHEDAHEIVIEPIGKQRK